MRQFKKIWKPYFGKKADEVNFFRYERPKINPNETRRIEKVLEKARKSPEGGGGQEEGSESNKSLEDA